MDKHAHFAAEVITQAAPALAALTADRFLSQDSTAAMRYQPGAMSKWRESISTRLSFLAAAVRSSDPAIFAHQVGWAKISAHSRAGEQGVKDLAGALDALREVLRIELSPESLEPTLECFDAAMCQFAELPSVAPMCLCQDSAHSVLASEYMTAMLEGDRSRACAVVLEKLHAGDISVRGVYEDVIIPVQRELGRLWHMRRLSIPEEHFATATAQHLMSQAYPMLSRKPWNGQVVLAASVEGNSHDLGIHMIADFLEADGWRAVYLGQNVPARELSEAAGNFKADLVALSAGLATQLPVVEQTIQLIRLAHTPENPAPKILVGGGAFEIAAATFGDGSGDASAQLAAKLGADAFARSLLQAVAEASRVCRVRSL